MRTKHAWKIRWAERSQLFFYPAGPQPQWLYVAENNRVVRYAYKVGDDKADGVPEIVVPMLSNVATGHVTRYIAFAWGRPVGAVVAKDGSLLASDGGANTIYRISHLQ